MRKFVILLLCIVGLLSCKPTENLSIKNECGCDKFHDSLKWAYNLNKMIPDVVEFDIEGQAEKGFMEIYKNSRYTFILTSDENECKFLKQHN